MPILIIVAVLAAAVSSAWYLKRSNTQSRGLVAPATSGQPIRSSGPVKVGAEPPNILGDPNAPIMLEEFGDFQCPSCATLHVELKKLKAEFGPRLVVVFREYPLATVHRNSQAAALAAEAAGLQGRFWEMHSMLYENQKIWQDLSEVQPTFEQYATDIGLDLSRFKRDIISDTVKRRIVLDQERGRWIGVTGTPTVFLNGREVPVTSLTADNLRPLINVELTSGRKTQ